jgi:hypothetical protein
LPIVGQSGVLQASPIAQSRSQRQAAEQSTVSHASEPLQVIEHFEPLRQSMSLQALPPIQLIVQVQPVGHVTLPHESLLVHSAVQVLSSSSHSVQSLGQFGTTQNPLLHWRLSSNPAQSAVVSHVNDSDGRSTKHAANNAAPIRAPSFAGLIRSTIIALTGER